MIIELLLHINHNDLHEKLPTKQNFLVSLQVGGQQLLDPHPPSSLQTVKSGGAEQKVVVSLPSSSTPPLSPPKPKKEEKPEVRATAYDRIKERPAELLLL